MSVYSSTLKLTCLIEINFGKKNTAGPEMKTISVEVHVVHVMRFFVLQGWNTKLE